MAPVFTHINLLSRKLLVILNKYGWVKERFVFKKMFHVVLLYNKFYYVLDHIYLGLF